MLWGFGMHAASTSVAALFLDEEVKIFQKQEAITYQVDEGQKSEWKECGGALEMRLT